MYSAYPGIALRGQGGALQSALYGFDPYKLNGNPAITGTFKEQVTADYSNTYVGLLPALEGKTYIEFELTSKSDTAIYQAIGVFDFNVISAIVWYNGGWWDEYGRLPLTLDGCGIGSYAGLANNGGFPPSGNAALNWGAGDRMGMAFDASTGNLWFRRNGAWQQGKIGRASCRERV